MEPNDIPPKNEWPNLTVQQLYEVKNAMTTKYWNMRSINASFASQYLGFIAHVERIIAFKEQEQQTAETY